MSELHENFIVDEAGHKTAVVLPVKEYEELLGDLHDLAAIAERIVVRDKFILNAATAAPAVNLPFRRACGDFARFRYKSHY